MLEKEKWAKALKERWVDVELRRYSKTAIEQLWQEKKLVNIQPI